jgi:hypothetical protein
MAGRRRSVRILEQGWIDDVKPAPYLFLGPARAMLEKDIDLKWVSSRWFHLKEAEYARTQISVRKQLYRDDPAGIDVEFMMKYNRKTRLRRIAKTLKIRDYIARDGRCKGRQFVELLNPLEKGGHLEYLGTRSWAEAVYDRLLGLIEEEKLHRVADFSALVVNATATIELNK